MPGRMIRVTRRLVLVGVTALSWAAPAGDPPPEPSFSAASGLEDGFREPPHEAKPHTWYHLMNGNATKEGVTRDFEELSAAGIGGVQMFDAGCAIPAGPLAFNSPEWFDLLKHAASEAKRLGLEVCLPNCSGWSSSGGPWNPASNAMKKVVFTETRVKGGSTFDGRLPQPEDPCGFYEDIAVLAVPVPPAKAYDYADQRFTSEGETVSVVSPLGIEASGYSVKIEFKPVWRAYADLAIEITRDGAKWEPYARRRIALSLSGRGSQDYRFFAFPEPMRLKGLRIAIRYLNATGSSRRPVEAKAVGLRLERKLEIPSLECKTLMMRGDFEPQTFEGAEDQVVAKDAVVPLGDAMAADGGLRWSAPATAADWTLLRIGYATQPVYNHPASRFGRGFEVDKLSAAAMDFHFEQYVAKLCRTLGPLAGGETGLNNILVDSYEVGSQNWTKGFEDEFRRRCGYDLVRYLPAFAGYVVGNADETERFLWDFRRTVADLFAGNYAGALARKCHEYGLKLSLEPYGSGPFDNLQYGRHADIPMGEFWSRSRHPGYCGEAGNARYAAYVGHVWGRRYIGAESFTANPIDSGAWLTTPELIKPIGDAAFADGVNRIIYHRYVHQPWADDRYVPGLTMGPWGMHFDRHNTWWPYAKEFLRYQARCQFMLQQGLHVADVLFWCGEDAPNQGGNTDGGNVSPYRLPYGYDWDVCETEAFRRLKVEDGCILAPGGTKYRLLVLPPSGTMSPEIVAKLGGLVRAGAKVAGPVRPTAAPGLRGRPSADGRVAAEAAEIWAAGVMELEAEAALKSLGVEPDVALADGPTGPRWDHRRTDEADIYFLCRNNAEEETLTCSFRTNGRRPEIWDAEKGTMSLPRQWHEEGGRTFVTLDFETCGSAFVVFRKTPTAGLKRLETSVPIAEKEVGGPWEVSFAAKYEGAPKPRRFDRLMSWTESDDPDLRYLSGSATYAKTLEIAPPTGGERIILDLGTVKNFAEVTVNGRAYPPLWKPPYRLDITDALSSGSSSLAVKVTNLWPNRLIGDDALPADVEWRDPGSANQPIREIPQWVRDGRRSPTGRHAFTTWRFWKSGDPLLPSGLLGPVRLISEEQK